MLYPFKDVERRFNAGYNEVYEFPRYNIRPTQKMPIVVQHDGKNELVMAQWGLTPAWMKGKVLFNTRDESVATKPFFNSLFKKYRCLIPADGFYEWQHIDGKKQPYRITLKSDPIFGFAGIYEMNKEKKLLQFSIITTEPNALVAKIHNRMPVIIPKESENKYINEESDADDLLKYLKPYPASQMESYPVSTLVNSSKNDGADVIKPLK